MDFRLSEQCGSSKISKYQNTATFFYPGQNETFSCPYVVTLPPGSFAFECWGASGQNSGTKPGGFGGYTYGEITLSSSTSFYLFVGANKTNSQRDVEIYNGGGAGDIFGGGSSDIRFLNIRSWSDFQSLKSRIMVAAGGGGHDGVDGHGGNGGGIEGESSLAIPNGSNGNGGNQTYGGIGYVSGGFGRGGSSVEYNHETGSRLDNNGGGGSGYYGGSTGKYRDCCGGGGGSSFISGYSGCDSINESSTEFNIIHTGQSYHYSGFIFHNANMISGNNTMPLPSFTYGIGHHGSGAIRISAINSSLLHSSPSLSKNCHDYTINIHVLIYFISTILC